MLQCLKEAVQRQRPSLLTWRVLLLHNDARLRAAYITPALLDTWRWSPSTIQPHLGSVGLPHVLQTEKTFPRLMISIWHHCQSQGLEVASRAGCLLLPGCSMCCCKCLNRNVDCGKIKDWCPNMIMCFACHHFPPLTLGGRTNFLTFLCKKWNTKNVWMPLKKKILSLLM